MQKVRAYQRAIVIHKLLRVRDTSQYKVVSEEFANEHHHKTNQDPPDIAQKLIEAVRISSIPKIIISDVLLGIQKRYRSLVPTIDGITGSWDRPTSHC